MRCFKTGVLIFFLLCAGLSLSTLTSQQHHQPFTRSLMDKSTGTDRAWFQVSLPTPATLPSLRWKELLLKPLQVSTLSEPCWNKFLPRSVPVPTLSHFHLKVESLWLFFPNVQDLKKYPDQSNPRLYAFWALAVFIIVFFGAVLETINWLKGDYKRDYVPLEVLHQHNEHDEDKFQAYNQKFVRSINFASFLTFYHVSCWFVAILLMQRSMVSTGYGLDYEFYILWLIFMGFMHVACLLKSKYKQDPFDCFKKLFSSVLVFLSEPLDGLRDPVVAVIYWSAGYRVAAFIVFIGAALPLFMVLQNETAFKELQQAYWPLLLSPKAKSSPGFKLGVLLWFKEQTNSVKRLVVMYEEVPQFLASVILFFQGGCSFLSILVGSVAVFKFLAVVIFRPFILRQLALSGGDWEGVSATDIDAAISGADEGQLDSFALVLGPIFLIEDDPYILKAALDSLDKLSMKQDARSPILLPLVQRSPTLASALLPEECFSKLESFTQALKTLEDEKSDSSAVCEALKSLAKVPGSLVKFADKVVLKLQDDVNPNVRQAALKALSVCDPAELINYSNDVAGMLNDGDARVRQAALETIGKLDAVEFRKYIENVIAKTNDSDEDVCSLALETLARHDCQYVVIAKLEDPSPDVCCAALETLGKLNPLELKRYSDLVVRKLQDTRKDVCVAALQIVVKFDPDEFSKWADTVFAKLDDKGFCQSVGHELGKLDSTQLAQYAELIAERVEHKSWEVRKSALILLGNLQQGILTNYACKVAGKLVDGDRDVCQAALETLGKMHPAEIAKYASGVIELLTDHEDAPVRTAAVKALGSLLPQDLFTYAATVVSMLTDKDEGVRGAAVETLGKLEPLQLSEFAEDLLDLMCRSQHGVCEAAANTLGHLEHTELRRFTDEIVGMLNAANRTQTIAAAMLLGKLEHTDYAKKLIARLAVSSKEVRLASAETLGKLDPNELAKYADKLMAYLEDQDWHLRQVVVQTLGKLDPTELAKLIGKLNAKLEHGDLDIFQAAVLGELCPTALAKHVDKVVEKLEHVDWDVRVAAVKTLGKLDRSEIAKHADKVIVMLKDFHPYVRRAAVQTLGKLDPSDLAEYADKVIEALDFRSLRYYADEGRFHVSNEDFYLIAELEQGNGVDAFAAAAWTLCKLETSELDKHAEKVYQMIGCRLLSGLTFKDFLKSFALQKIDEEAGEFDEEEGY